jgi:DNA repair protein RecO (recombination protein O)
MQRVRLYTTEVLLLRRMNLGEADRILTLYSPTEGKLRAVAKGIRRPSSRLGGHLEPFSRAIVQLARGRELDIVTQIESCEVYRRLREQLHRTAQGYYILELIDRLTPDRLPNPAVYGLACDALRTLDAAEILPLALPHFVLHVLGALGFRPELSECLNCRATIAPGRNWFSLSLGGALCPTCGPFEGTAHEIPTDVLKTLRYLQRTATASQARVLVPAEIAGGVDAVLRAYVEALVERHLGAGEFLDRLAATDRRQVAAAGRTP